MIKYQYDNEADIPEALKGEYVQKDGKWVLQVEGAVAKGVHDTFRNNNTLLSKERDTLKATVDALEEAGITLEDAIRLKGIENDLTAQKLYKKGEIDQIVQDRLKDATNKHEKEKSAVQKRLEQMQHELEVMRIDEAAVAVALKNGLEETAVEDIKARARSKFKLVDGRPKALSADGFEETAGDGQPLTIERYIQDLKPLSPHLFKRNHGGGGTPGRQGGGAPSTSGKNPFSKESFNLTEQGKLYRADPAKAQAMKEAAV